MRIVSSLFAEHRPDLHPAVPLIAFQETMLRRTPLDLDTTTDLGRFTALTWYLEHYAAHQRPFRAPLGGEQVRWLLASADTLTELHPLARIVEWFRRRDAGPDPYRGGREGYLETAYWWSVEKAVALNVEHALVPERFIAVLSAAAWDAPPGEAPPSEFLARFARRHPGFDWSFDSESRRLAAYMRVLMEPHGVHYGLFMPAGVLQRIADISETAGAVVQAAGPLAEIKRRAAASLAYAEQHRRLRAGENSCASLLGQDWMAQAWTPPPPLPGKGAEPRPRGRSALPVPVRVIGPLNSRSGLGQAARLSVAALQAVGVAVEPVDFMFENPAPRAAYLPSEPPGAADFAINLIHLNAESLPAAPAYMAPAVFENAYDIGYFFWELPEPARCHHLALQQVDEVWVASEFNRQAYAPVTRKPVTRVGMAVNSAPADIGDRREEVRRAWRLPEDATVFVTTFDSFSYLARKNPHAVVRAFLQAFPKGDENVRLVVKTHNLMTNLPGAGLEAQRQQLLSLCASDPRITLVNETLAHGDLLALKAASDVYVSLHRSEGWGFGMLESMQLGVPSIATAFSGNMDFCSDETGWLVPWTRRYVAPDEYAFFTPGDWWADPDIVAAAAVMREAAADPGEAARRGAAAKARADAAFSPEAVGAVYLERLKAIVAERAVRT